MKCINFIFIILILLVSRPAFTQMLPNCTDNSLNTSECRAVGPRYITPALGNNVTGSNGSLTVAVPVGFQNGTKSASITDTNLVAGKIKNGVGIFGVTGTLNAAFAACADNSLNAAQCSTALN